MLGCKENSEESLLSGVLLKLLEEIHLKKTNNYF